MQLVVNKILPTQGLQIMNLRGQMAHQGCSTPGFEHMRELAVYIRDELNLKRCATNRTTYSFTEIDED